MHHLDENDNAQHHKVEKETQNTQHKLYLPRDNGHDPQSFRAKGQGMLSVTRLLLHLRQWQSSSVVFQGVLVMDNTGLITRVRDQAKITYPSPNLVFQPDWDVVEAIARTVASMDMILRNCWATTVPDKIDWDAHRLATNNPLRRTHFVKLCHEMLPTGKLVNQYHPSYPDWCPLCRSPAEDHKHVLRCPHSTHITWHTKLLETLTKKCHSLHTDPVLTALLASIGPVR